MINELMNGLLHNLIADMYGPTFLLIYFLFIGATIIFCLVTLHITDPTSVQEPPPVPSQPDPYELAYLRFGEDEVVRLAVFNMIQRGFLAMTPQGNNYTIKHATQPPELRYLTPIELSIYKYFTSAQLPGEVFAHNRLPLRVIPQCAVYKERLEREQLLCTDQMVKRANQIKWAGILAIFALGSYKMMVALYKGHFNILGMILFGVIGIIITFLACRPARISSRGKAYLSQLHLAYDKFRTYPSQSATAPIDPNLTLTVVGLFGVGVLAGSYYNSYMYMFQQAPTIIDGSSGSWGSNNWSSSCSSSSSSCSSSSSSCSSSCGGSSCGGGGGCGGCGSS